MDPSETVLFVYGTLKRASGTTASWPISGSSAPRRPPRGTA